MADIVIKISEEDYERLKEYEKAPFNSLTSRAYEAIANGKPLPKGHGDLVDIETLCEMFWDGNSMEITKDDLSVIEPIIEADVPDTDVGKMGRK